MPVKFTDLIAGEKQVVLDRFKGLTPTKEPPRVIEQVPPAGSALVKGMTVLVRLLSPSDIRLVDVVPDAPIAVRDIPLVDLKKFVDEDAAAADILKGDTLTADKRAQFLGRVNTGLGGVAKGTVTDADADKTFTALKMIGRR